MSHVCTIITQLQKFGVGKTIAQLQKFCYLNRMNDIVSMYVKGCVMYATSKPSNQNLGLYASL